MNTKLKIGLALGGGAFRGLAHIGVLQVLEEAGIPVHCVAGTSMGALVGGVYCCGFDMKLLEKYTYTINEKDLIDVVIPREGLIAGSRIELLVRTLTGGRRFDQLKTPFRAMATDIEKGEAVMMETGLVCDAIRASISIPGVFKPVRREGRLLVDGGLVDIVPHDVLKDMGAEFVIAVDAGYHGGEVKCNSLASIMMQAFSVMEWHTMKDKVSAADLLVVPNLQHINMASLAQAGETIEIGRQEMRKQLPLLLERLHAKEAELHGAGDPQAVTAEA